MASVPESISIPGLSTPVESIVNYLSAEDEEALIQKRLINDEKSVRRILKKFHAYTTATSIPNAVLPSAVEDAREAFVMEVRGFELAIAKSVRVCKAEAAQTEVYKRESVRIRDEHGSVSGQIDQLKTQLEEAQNFRREKIEYDTIAHNVNSLPSRADLEEHIQTLENEVLEIRAEQTLQTRVLQEQKLALASIVGSLMDLRMIGKERVDPTISHAPSPRMTPGPETVEAGPSSMSKPAPAVVRTRSLLGLGISMKGSGEVENGEVEDDEEDIPLAVSTKLGRLTAKAEDVEMGEVSEAPSRNKKNREDLEEGEASDGSSELSEVPDDDDE